MTCPAYIDCPMCQPATDMCRNSGCSILHPDGSMSHPGGKEPWYLRISRDLLAVLILVTAIPILWVLAKIYEITYNFTKLKEAQR